MPGRREARAPGWGRYREVGWQLTRLLVGFGLAVATFAVLGVLVGAVVGVLAGSWGWMWRSLLWLPFWLVWAGGALFGGTWLFRPELLGGRRWPQVWRRVQ
jgi:hypothetical protein